MLEQVIQKEQSLASIPGLTSSQQEVETPAATAAFSRIVALLSHDLRLPLSTILANAEFLTESRLTEIERDEFYREIRLAVDRMNEIISSLLECSKNSDAIRPAVHNIVDTVERAMGMIKVRKEFQRIAIKHRHQGLSLGWFDSTRLERVIANLIVNACEAISPGTGQVAITSIGHRTCMEIEVWDDGPGFPAAIRNAIFQPFITYGKAHGNGLGLAIAKKIVEEHGGDICLDENNKAGALFKITIPFSIPKGKIPLAPFHPIHSINV